MATLTAVLDSAVDTTHPELQGRITANVSQVGTLRSGVTHVYDHGTAAAGIIGATGNNGQGLTGIGQQQRLLLEEVITSEGAATSDVTAALYDAVQRGALGRLTVQRADGAAVLGSQEPLARALTGAGFTMTPRGLRLRPRGRG